MLEKIEQVLEEHVRPYLNSHNGNVVIKDYQDHVLTITLQGQCAGCPSADLTTNEFIKEKLQQFVPEIEEIILYTPVNEDLLNMAQKILKK